MDKETLSNYGWIVICVLVLAVMLALATPFGTFVADAVKATTAGFFSVNQNAMGAAGITIPGQEFESCEHDYEVTTTANCTTAGTTTHTCKLCGKSYSEETPAHHTFNGNTCTVCSEIFTPYQFKASDYDAKMGTTMATDANIVIPETFIYNDTKYKVSVIAGGAFSRCNSLTSIELPLNIAYIGDSAFFYCSSLKNIIIPESVTSIGGMAFAWCSSLENITIPCEVTAIGNSAFDDCTSLKNIMFSGTMAEWNAITLGTNWNKNVPATYVQCSDGQVPLS